MAGRKPANSWIDYIALDGLTSSRAARMLADRVGPYATDRAVGADVDLKTPRPGRSGMHECTRPQAYRMCCTTPGLDCLEVGGKRVYRDLRPFKRYPGCMRRVWRCVQKARNGVGIGHESASGISFTTSHRQMRGGCGLLAASPPHCRGEATCDFHGDVVQPRRRRLGAQAFEQRPLGNVRFDATVGVRIKCRQRWPSCKRVLVLHAPATTARRIAGGGQDAFTGPLLSKSEALQTIECSTLRMEPNDMLGPARLRASVGRRPTHVDLEGGSQLGCRSSNCAKPVVQACSQDGASSQPV